MVCHVCKYRMCFEHAVPWHTDFTCEEYDERDTIEEARSKELLARLPVQKCPGARCPYYVEKINGCDHMSCLGPTLSLVLVYTRLILVARPSLQDSLLLGLSCYFDKSMLLL